MKAIIKLLELLAPDVCVGCGQEGLPLCEVCQSTIAYPDRCHVCRKPTMSSITCDTCRRKSPLSALYVASSYVGDAKELVHRAKYAASRSSAYVMGTVVASKLPYLSADELIVTHVPTTGPRVRERGFDQAQYMVRGLCADANYVHGSLLARTTLSHQVGSSRKERIEHMVNAFTLKNARLVVGKTVLIVDDVYTTGATLESAARTLKKAGAKRVIGAVFARAE